MNAETTPAVLSMEDRILRWREEDGGTETEGRIELLCDAEDELRRRATVITELRGACDAALAVIPCLKVENWPPGFELKKTALSKLRAAIAQMEARP